MFSRRFFIAVVGLGILELGFATASVRAQDENSTLEKASEFRAAPEKRGSIIRDAAALFDPAALEKASAGLSALQSRVPLNVVIDVIPALKGESLGAAASRQMKRFDAPGLFVLIDKLDHKLEVTVSPQYQRIVTKAKQGEIRDAFLNSFRKGKFDDGLREGVRTIAAILDEKGVNEQLAEAKNVKTAASPLIARGKIQLTLAGARSILQGAVEKADELGLKSNIALVDAGGQLLAFERMDGARSASIATSITKAVSAATFLKATGPTEQKPSTADPMLDLNMQIASLSGGGKFTTLAGGIPITVDGEIIGAVGVGGASGEDDKKVAQAGIDHFLSELQATPAPEKKAAAPADADPFAKP